MRYIDADKLYLDLEKSGYCNDNWLEVESILLAQPTADVVPMDFHDRCMEIEIQKRMNMVDVVRCKDCKFIRHGGDERNGTVWFCSLYCKNKNGDINDFCSFGERAEE